jgi:hypothetical protein
VSLSRVVVKGRHDRVATAGAQLSENRNSAPVANGTFQLDEPMVRRVIQSVAPTIFHPPRSVWRGHPGTPVKRVGLGGDALILRIQRVLDLT